MALEAIDRIVESEWLVYTFFALCVSHCCFNLFFINYTCALWSPGAGSDSTARIALASALVQHGGADFDASAGTNAISTLLEGR